MRKIGERVTYSKIVMAWVMLFTFVFYFANISLFSHYHVVDGVTIVHSHIRTANHANNPLDSSAHTKNELTLISAISNYLVESPSAPITLGDAFTIVVFLFIICNAPIVAVANSIHPPLRGPPAYLLIG